MFVTYFHPILAVFGPFFGFWLSFFDIFGHLWESQGLPGGRVGGWGGVICLFWAILGHFCQFWAVFHFGAFLHFRVVRGARGGFRGVKGLRGYLAI